MRIEGGGDRHALLVDRHRCRLYELFALRREDGRWHAGSGATWSLCRPRMRPAGWTSADAAGLPILPLLARPGRIDHALRVTVSRTRIVADNGSDWFISGAPDPRWDDEQLHALAGLSGRDFEVVDTGR